MRLFVLMLLLLVSTPAMAQQASFLQQVRGCVMTATKYTEYATLANDSKDSDQPAFMAFVQQEADAQSNPRVKQMLLHMGELAWLARGHDPHADAMDLYDKCYSSLGTKA